MELPQEYIKNLCDDLVDTSIRGYPLYFFLQKNGLTFSKFSELVEKNKNLKDAYEDSNIASLAFWEDAAKKSIFGEIECKPQHVLKMLELMMSKNKKPDNIVKNSEVIINLTPDEFAKKQERLKEMLGKINKSISTDIIDVDTE